MLLRHYLEQGLAKSAIAERTGLSRRTIHYWLATGELDRDPDAAIRSPPRATKLDRFHDLICQRLETYPELTAVRLLWVQCYARQTMRTLMTGLEAAFAALGGVPRELLFDQLKAVIVDDRRPDDGKVVPASAAASDQDRVLLAGR